MDDSNPARNALPILRLSIGMRNKYVETDCSDEKVAFIIAVDSLQKYQGVFSQCCN
jgi:hypothetical protein